MSGKSCTCRPVLHHIQTRNRLPIMVIKKLYHDLVKAYSNENLNLITGKLIMLYKNKNYHNIREIANRISEFVSIDEEKDARCFSRLVMLYHPDRGEHFRREIKNLYEQSDYAKLRKHSHILLMDDIDNIIVTKVDEDIDYHPEYAWDMNTDEGFGFEDAGEENEDAYEPGVDFEKSFYNLVKMREYGSVNIEFPFYYLEDFEEFEMAYSGLETLDGVEHCIHAKILDVSNNSISDIENLWNLKSLEELYLTNNQIGYIDTLSNLVNLKVVDLSGNQIDDISPLLELENLEYVNLIGNPVPKSQIDLLEAKGIIVAAETFGTQDIQHS